jgi:glycosyltransferase involved in cell wall biosynthesis
MRPLRVILPVESVAYPLTGIGRYTYELAQGLMAHSSVAEVRLLRHLRWADPDRLESLAFQGRGRSAVPASTRAKVGYVRQLRRYGRFVASSLRFFRCVPYGDHILHSPNYALPAFSGRRVSTIHDLSIFRYPQFHPADRVAHMRWIFPDLLRRGDLFLTDSEFSRREILEYCNVEEDRVVSVPLGVDPRFRPMGQVDSSPILQGLGLVARRYTLSVGTIEPRKNVERLIHAYRSLPIHLRTEFPLVLAGNEGWNSASIHKHIEAAESEGWLKYLDYVEESELPALYAGARVFVCVSLYEGFGLPVLEALAAGAPVICSNVASLPEVGGGAVKYVDPLGQESIRQGLIELLESDALLMQMRQAGLRRAREFSWSRTVQGTVEAYQRLL